MKNRVTGILLFVSFATILPAQDAVPAPPAEKKGGGRPARPPRPGVATPGVKREMTTLTPAAVISIPGTPDWQVMTDDAMWVSNGPKNTVHRIDVKTNEQVAIDAGRRPCSGLAAGFGSVWVPLCGDRPGTENGAKPAVARIDRLGPPDNPARPHVSGANPHSDLLSRPPNCPPLVPIGLADRSRVIGSPIPTPSLPRRSNVVPKKQQRPSRTAQTEGIRLS